MRLRLPEGAHRRDRRRAARHRAGDTPRVIQNVRFKYACRSREGTDDDGPTVVVAPPPPPPIPKSNASPGLLAFIATSKFQDGIPHYRLESILGRSGIHLPRATSAGWTIRLGDLITPLVNLMDETQLGYDVLEMDETTVRVLKEAGREAEAKSCMWVRRGGEPGRSIILFDYEPSRSAAVPMRILADYTGPQKSIDSWDTRWTGRYSFLSARGDSPAGSRPPRAASSTVGRYLSGSVLQGLSAARSLRRP